VWPAAQAINFLFLPPQFRVLYVGAVTLFWDSFLSYIKHERALVESNDVEHHVESKTSFEVSLR
jgi:protein Mpv17